MEAGDQLAGRYRLVEPIGAGGMGEVWRGEQITLGRAVAIKILHSVQGAPGTPSSSAGSSAEARFRREAELVAKVEHRNVVDIIDFGTEDGVQFLVMPLLSGETLGERMGRSPRPDLGELVALLRPVLSGLAAIHDAGIVHRDLKPANVFLVRDADGVVPKLLDFGISREEKQTSGTALTQEGIMMGTPQYMAPEQFESASKVDARADVFSVGAILYEALTGQPPYVGGDPFTIYRKILAGEGQRLDVLRTDLPPGLCELVHGALATEPEQRFGSARAMREALDTLVSSGVLAGVSASDFPTMNARGHIHNAISAAPTAMAPGIAASTPPAVALAPTAHATPAPTASPVKPADAPATKTKSPALQALMAAGGLGVLALVGVLVFQSMQAPPAPPPTTDAAAPPTESEELPSGVDPVDEPPAIVPESLEDPWFRLASVERPETAAIRWSRLPLADRVSVQLARVEGRWGSYARIGEAEATRLADELSGEAERLETAPAGLLRPALLSTRVRLNVRARADRDSETREVLPHDSLVVALYGEVDGSPSAHEGDGAMTYFVSTLQHSGWGVSSLLREGGECRPLPGALVRDGGLPPGPTRRTFRPARTEVIVGGTRRDVFLVAAHDEQSATSAIGIYAERNCELGERLGVHAIDGVIDEYFLSDTEEESLLVVSWYSGQHPPADGRREWAAFRLGVEAPVWSYSGLTAPVHEDHGSVTGTRDRALRGHDGYVLKTKERRQDGLWYRFEGGRVVRAPAP
ncbi:MAG: serine/threonine protein kinase [Polyangiales bacterium]